MGETENEYLELADHCKKLVEEKEKKLKDMKEQNIELKKLLMVSYAMSRIIDFYSQDDEIINDLIEITRGFMSHELDIIFFDKEDVNINLN